MKERSRSKGKPLGSSACQSHDLQRDLPQRREAGFPKPGAAGCLPGSLSGVPRGL